MVNATALKVAMVKRDVKAKNLSSKCGISYHNLLKKFKSPHSWNLDDAKAVANSLELSDEEVLEIFFEKKLGD